jgi:nitrate reductase gamma subunit
MWNFIAEAKRTLWAFVELGFLAVLAIILIHLLLGEGAGSYVTSVADNVTKFATAASSGLLGVVIVLAIVYLVLRRASWSHSESTAAPTTTRK